MFRSTRLVFCLPVVLLLFVVSSAHVYLGPENEKYLAHSHKGEHNPHPGWHIDELDEAGGPDAGGYVYRDSNEEDGPVYAWVDISATGTAITDMDDDDYSDPIELPWTFSFYGNDYTEVYICSNGFLRFGLGSEEYDNTALPDYEAPNNLLAFFWNDLDPSSGGTIYYGVDNQNRWICQFDQIREFDDSGAITAEVILDESGAILFQYEALENGIDIGGETIGIENEFGAIGLTVSLDDSPESYPYASLAVLLEQLEFDATLSGTITDTENGRGVAGVTVEFGNLSTVSDVNGNYSLDEIWSGVYDVHVYANGYFDTRAEDVVLTTGDNTYNYMLTPSGMPSGFVGYWTFDDQQDLLHADVGNDLVLVGAHTAIDGPDDDDNAVTITEGNFYRCYHDIAPNGAYGEPEWVNQFTIVMDIRIPELDDWYCIYQTNYENSNDGDCFVHTSGAVGVAATGYSDYNLVPGEWYRLAISANLGVSYNYYLDGRLLQIGGAQSYEGRFALYPANDANQVLFFADNNDEDGPIDVAQIQLYDRDLTASEIATLGGYGHEFESPEIYYMDPFLQTPTPNSIYVCWHSSSSTESILNYGLDETLDMQATGDHHVFNEATIWHWVKLENLDPLTTYYYRVISGADSSEIHAFTTQQVDGNDQRPVRFVVYSDPQTSEGHHAVIEAMEEKLVELYGEDFHEDVQLIMTTGDIVNTGSDLAQYTSLFFNNNAPVTDNLPLMNAIGNHEAEAEIYYDYMLYDDFAGPEGEVYYSFWVGNALYIVLNSNIQGDTQITWLENLLDDAEADPALDWVFVFLHHPGRSETWPDGNTAWTQNEVIPLLTQHPKVEMLCYGHTHSYERGAPIDGTVRLMCFGGGGGHLDRWRDYENQTDYPEIHRAHDYYGYAIFEINPTTESYSATAYTLGNEDHPLENTVMDSWVRDRTAAPPLQPQSYFPDSQGDINTVLTASPCISMFPVMSSQFQVSTSQEDWSNPVVDSKRDWENVYYDTGDPDYEPIDLNEGIDLTRLNLGEMFEVGETLFWRVRYRDQNLLWSEWSDTSEFVVADLPPGAEFTSIIQVASPVDDIHFTDLSIGEVESWSWDLDGDNVIDSEERDPVFQYEEAGEYTVTLTVVIDGATYTEVKTDYIRIVDERTEEADRAIPDRFDVSPPYPNPFNASTIVTVALPGESRLEVTLFNILGQEVVTLFEGTATGGYKTFNLDSQTIASGTYYLQVSSPVFGTKIRKVVCLK